MWGESSCILTILCNANREKWLLWKHWSTYFLYFQIALFMSWNLRRWKVCSFFFREVIVIRMIIFCENAKAVSCAKNRWSCIVKLSIRSSSQEHIAFTANKFVLFSHRLVQQNVDIYRKKRENISTWLGTSDNNDLRKQCYSIILFLLVAWRSSTIAIIRNNTSTKCSNLQMEIRVLSNDLVKLEN